MVAERITFNPDDPIQQENELHALQSWLASLEVIKNAAAQLSEGKVIAHNAVMLRVH